MARAQTAWVLVRKGPGAPNQYFTIAGDEVQWQRDVNDAVRFSRREDALNIKRTYVVDSQPEEVVFG